MRRCGPLQPRDFGRALVVIEEVPERPSRAPKIVRPTRLAHARLETSGPDRDDSLPQDLLTAPLSRGRTYAVGSKSHLRMCARIFESIESS